jgi:hypothetical protein
MSVSSSRTRRRIRFVGSAALQVVIVFVGVWAAFALEGQRDRQRNEARRIQALQLLHEQFSGIHQEITQASAEMQRVYGTGFLDLVRAGERPLPIPFTFRGGGLETGTWQAILQAGGLDVLDLELIRDIEAFNGHTRAGLAAAQRIDRHSTDVIVPRLSEGAGAFYDPSTGVPLPETNSYIDDLQHTLWLLQSITGRAAEVRDAIARRIDGDQTARATGG